MRYSEVKGADDLSQFLDIYRGAGVSKIINEQLSQDILSDEALAFSMFGDFINALVQHHATVKMGSQITDDFVFADIKAMLGRMAKDPKYADYHEFIEDKLKDLEGST